MNRNFNVFIDVFTAHIIEYVQNDLSNRFQKKIEVEDILRASLINLEKELTNGSDYFDMMSAMDYENLYFVKDKTEFSKKLKIMQEKWK